MLSNLSEPDVLTRCLAISGWIVLRPPTADGPPWWINHFARRGSLICENLYEPRVAKRRTLLSSSVNVKSDIGQIFTRNRSIAAWQGCHQARNNWRTGLRVLWVDSGSVPD